MTRIAMTGQDRADPSFEKIGSFRRWTGRGDGRNCQRQQQTERAHVLACTKCGRRVKCIIKRSLKVTYRLVLLTAVAALMSAQTKAPAKKGVKTPGVQIPLASLKPEAV